MTAEQVTAQIEERLKAVHRDRWIEVAFFGGSFTALPAAVQRDLLSPAHLALEQGRIHAIRLSTRPDCINGSIIANLKKHGVSIVELGVQSLDDNVLLKACRGHNSQDVIEATRLLKKSKIQCGLQLMPGLPGEDWISLLATVRKMIELRPDFVRIYPTIVIKDTVLAEQYSQGTYQPLTLSAAVARSAYMKLVFEQAGIAVIRTGLQATEELDSKASVIAGPYHPAFGELVDSHIFYLMLAAFLEQDVIGRRTEIGIRYNPKDASKIRGQYNSNIKRLVQRYKLTAFNLSPDSAVKNGSILLTLKGDNYLLNKNMINRI